MLSEHLPQAKLTTVASFPRNYFLENLAVRTDNSSALRRRLGRQNCRIGAIDDLDPKLLH
jgi:hypothetical protein